MQTSVPFAGRSAVAGMLACAVAGLALLATHPTCTLAAEDDPFVQLREEEVVTGAGKRPQPLSEVPSSVSVITAAEIRANGYRTLGEALRWVRGFYAAYDRNYTYIGVRGLQRPGDYNNKVLLTIDGHSMNGNVFADGLFGPELGLDMETVERIEVVRGPGSALYGSHAVLAVVNVVTRRPGSQPGVSAAASYGEWRDRRGHVAIAAAAPGRPAWSAAGSWLKTRGPDLYFAEFDSPLTRDGLAVQADGEDAANFLGTAEWAGLRLAVKFNERTKHVPTAAYGTTFGDPRFRTVDGQDFVELSGTRQLSDALELHGRAYWDAKRYHGYYVYGPDTATYVNFDRGDGDVLGTEWRANWSPGRGHVVTLGAEGQHHPRIILENYDLDPYALYLQREVRCGTGGVYLQDEARLGPRARVTAGARVDFYPEFDPVLSPRLDLIWQTGPATTWKLLAGTAFRAPSVYEKDYEDGYSQIRNLDLQPERVVTVEGAVERSLGRFKTALAAYGNRVRDLIDLVQIDTLGTLQFQNRDRVKAIGLEGEVEYVGPAGTRVRAALAYQESEVEATRDDLSNSPHWNGHLVVSQPAVVKPVSVGFGMRYLSPRLTLAGSRTSEALVTDARVGVRLQSGLALGCEARNLFDARYGDPASGEHTQDQILQDGRALFVTLSYRPGSAY